MATQPDDELLEYALQRAREQLASDPRTSELEVRLSCAGNKVFVYGTVATDERRHAITEVIGEAMPDYEIHDQMSLVELTPALEAEELS